MIKTQLFSGLAVAALCVSFAGCHKHALMAKGGAPPQPQVAESKPAPMPERTPEPPRHEAVAENRAPAVMPDAATRNRIQDLLERIQDAYFDYNQHSLRPDAEAALRKDAQTLTEIIQQYPNFKLTVEGYCDDRGSDEYNLALGEARARQAKEYIASLGLPANQLQTVSYGKERPICSEQTEECWQKNRRAHITQAQ